MQKFLSILRGKNGEECTADVTVEKTPDEINCVYVNGEADFALDAMDGVRIYFENIEEPEDLCSLFRVSEFWCQPRFGSKWAEVPDETQGLIAKQKDGYLVILPVVSALYRCVIAYDGKTDKLCAKLLSQCDTLCKCDTLAFVYTVTDNPFHALNELYKKAIGILGTGVKLREEREYPEMFEYLGWCSWDALHIEVNEDGLLEKCREFKDNNIPVRWAIIDDMWADIPNFRTHTYSNGREMIELMHASPIASFEADPYRFPNGLKVAVEKMKEYLTWVGIWHPTTGYWFGIDPNSLLFSKFEKYLYHKDDGRYIPKPDKESFSYFFDSFHTFLEECGADFVKVDNQSIFRYHYRHTNPIGKAARDMHNALEESTTKHFGNRMINCMGCANENIWNRPASAVTRCSDDFLPEKPEWFTKHILQCSFMSLFQGPMYISDWDMWWTDDGQAKKNSLLRAISGGPIYVSDKIGRSKREILMPLCYEDGRILRCDRPAYPTKDSLTGNPEKNGRAFKIQNTCGSSGVLTVFNLDTENGAVSSTVSPSDIFDLTGDDNTEYAVFEHITHTFFTMKKNERKELELPNRDAFKFYTFTPITEGFAAIGRTDKLLSPLTVKSVDGDNVELYEKGPYAYCKDGKFFEIME